jgi:hypothetical protein
MIVNLCLKDGEITGELVGQRQQFLFNESAIQLYLPWNDPIEYANTSQASGKILHWN